MKLNRVRHSFREFSFALPAFVFMTVVFVVPLLGIVDKSIQLRNDGGGPTIASYTKMFSTSLFARVASVTIQICTSATICSLILAYPVAYFLSRQTPRRRVLYMILVLVPFWTSSLVKVFSFVVLLGRSGIINQALGAFGIGPVNMLFNRFGVMVGMSNFLVPFFVFPILASLQSQPSELGRAAATMGAGKLRIFLRVTLPLSLPGVIAGALLVFIISLGFYVIPALLGGRQDIMLSNLVDFYAREVLDWPMASAVAMLLIIAAAAAASLLSRVRGGSSLLQEEGP